jgi:hypothetical protein
VGGNFNLTEEDNYNFLTKCAKGPVVYRAPVLFIPDLLPILKKLHKSVLKNVMLVRCRNY